MYAITTTGYRAISPDAALAPDEQRIDVLPQSLLDRIATDRRRQERDELLRATDWTQMADAPLTVAQKAAMAVYRQQLRDLPAKPGFPEVAWPLPPTLDGAAGGVGPVEI